jgi:hypothetical protein
MEVEFPVQLSHFLFLVLPRELINIVCHAAQDGNVTATGLVATQLRGQALKKLPDLVRLTDMGGVEIADEHPQVVDRLHQAEPLQFNQRFPYSSLGDAQFTGQALLAQALPGLAFPGEDAALNLFANMMACYLDWHTAFLAESHFTNIFIRSEQGSDGA